MDIGAVAAINPFAATGMMLGENFANFFGRTKMYARYLGKTEYYDKVSNCPPVTLVHGRVYQISVQLHSYMHNGWTIVRIYDDDGRYLTWVPYAVDYRRYWGQV